LADLRGLRCRKFRLSFAAVATSRARHRSRNIFVSVGIDHPPARFN